MKTALELVREEILSLTPYIPGKHIKQVEAELGITDIVKLASNENPLGPSPKVKVAATNAVLDCNFYPDSNCTELRQSLAEYLQVGQDNLVFGNGAHELIFLLTATFLHPGEEAVIPSPTFGEYAAAVKLAGGVVKPVPLRNFCIDLEACLEEITERTKMIFICNPNNPTGTCIGADELKRFMDKVPGHVLVVLDEAYREYVDDTAYQDGLEYVRAGRNIVVLRTFSKAFALAGLRVGYAVAPIALAGYLGRVRQIFNVDSIAQVAAVASLEDREYLQNAIEVNKLGKEYLYRAFEEMDLDYVPTQANFLLVNIKGDSYEVFQELLKLGVIVRPAAIFGLPRHLRVSIGTPEQNNKFIRALSRVLALLDLDQFVIAGK
ncbi:MAG TPA: histidinol-phosphate transaminase [Candidatus Deferrimicrobium sp.]|nr:histidinol-phosphate transaminase [Candidatus Deferrimicrobium sp.]